MIPHIEPWYGKQAAKAVYDLVGSGSWLTEYKKTRELEEKIAGYLGVNYCFMYPNCTLALYAACQALDIGHDSLVAVPDMTMIASANAVRIGLAGVWLQDVDQKTLCLRNRRNSIDAIVAVDLNGKAPDYNELRSFGVPIIEDAAQAFGSFHNGKPLGTFGDIGCFSFSPHKIISMGQGGCCVTNNAGLADRLKVFKNFGRKGSGGFQHDEFGINLKFTDLQAVIGLAQLETLDRRIERKKEIFQSYYDQLSDYVEFLPIDLEQTTPWYIDIYTPFRDGLAKHLQENDIGTQKMYPALHTTREYRHFEDFPVSTWAMESGLFLPSSPTLTNGQIGMICDMIKFFIDRKGF